MARRSQAGKVQKILLRALDDLPAPLREAMEKHNVTVDILPVPPPGFEDAYGTFAGGSTYDFESTSTLLPEPPRIEIYVSSFEDLGESARDLEEEIRLTLFHEIGHFLGFGEEDLEDV